MAVNWAEELDFAGLEQANGLPSGLLAAVAQQESKFNPVAVNPTSGASGMFQFMPATAKEHGIDPLDPRQAAPAAAKYLGTHLKKYGGDVPKALAAYNWGPGNVDRKGMSSAPKETRDYIASVQGIQKDRAATDRVFADDLARAREIERKKIFAADIAKARALEAARKKIPATAPNPADIEAGKGLAGLDQMMLGFGNEVYAGLAAAGGTIADIATGKPLQYGKRFGTELKKTEDLIDVARAAQPKRTALAEVGGAATSLLAMPAAGAAKAATAVAAKTGIGNTIAKFAAPLATDMTLGGVTAVGTARGDVKERMEAFAPAAITSGVAGQLFRSAGSVVKTAAAPFVKGAETKKHIALIREAMTADGRDPTKAVASDFVRYAKEMKLPGWEKMTAKTFEAWEKGATTLPILGGNQSARLKETVDDSQKAIAAAAESLRKGSTAGVSTAIAGVERTLASGRLPARSAEQVGEHLATLKKAIAEGNNGAAADASLEMTKALRLSRAVNLYSKADEGAAVAATNLPAWKRHVAATEAKAVAADVRAIAAKNPTETTPVTKAVSAEIERRLAAATGKVEKFKAANDLYQYVNSTLYSGIGAGSERVMPKGADLVRLGEIKDYLRNLRKTMAPDPAFARMAERADDLYANLAKQYKATDVLKASGVSAEEKFAKKIISKTTPFASNSTLRVAGPAARAASQREFIDAAMDHARMSDGVDKALDTDKLLNYLEDNEKVAGTLFKGGQKDIYKGLLRLAETAPRVDKESRGAIITRIAAGLGGASVAAAAGTAGSMPAVGISLALTPLAINKLTTTARGQQLLLSAARTTPNTPAWTKLMKEVYDFTNKTGVVPRIAGANSAKEDTAYKKERTQ